MICDRCRKTIMPIDHSRTIKYGILKTPKTEETCALCAECDKVWTKMWITVFGSTRVKITPENQKKILQVLSNFLKNKEVVEFT
jgi:hypothetical protein